MRRTRAYRRFQRYRVIARKKRIIRDQRNYWYYTFEGVLSKGKIHCSCPLCRRKSYDSLSLSDMRKRERQDYDEEMTYAAM